MAELMWNWLELQLKCQLFKKVSWNFSPSGKNLGEKMLGVGGTIQIGSWKCTETTAKMTKLFWKVVETTVMYYICLN